MPPQQEKIVAPPNALEIIRAFVKNDLIEEAEKKAKQWGLKLKIVNGEIIDESNSTDSYLRKFITLDSQMLVMKDDIRKIATSKASVLIQGETGTGKELVARALHGDREGQFIAVNCAGMPDTLIESLLFGHMQGSFTGANKTVKGYMHLAYNGTLFLDEVGELPLHLQAKLLRAIQSMRIRRLGAEVEEEINCRFVCATNRDIRKLIMEDKFRIDLFARLSTFELFVSPLRIRTCDIIPIIKSIEGGEALIKYMTDNKIDNNKLDLTLNVRSLQRYVERYKVLGRLVV